MKFIKIFITLVIFIFITNVCILSYGETLKLKTEFMETTSKGRDYNDFFWTDNSDGDLLRIEIKNNGKQAVEHYITHGKNAIRSQGLISPGKSVLLTLKDDRSGRWTIDAFSSDGNDMNIIVTAKQYKKDLDNNVKVNKEFDEKLNNYKKKYEYVFDYLKYTNQIDKFKDYMKHKKNKNFL